MSHHRGTVPNGTATEGSIEVRPGRPGSRYDGRTQTTTAGERRTRTIATGERRAMPPTDDGVDEQ